MIEKSIYKFSVKHLSKPTNMVFSWLANIMSPTWRYASRKKKNLNAKERAEGIIARNYFYLFFSILLTLTLGLTYDPITRSLYSPLQNIILFIVLYAVTWSRCNEILFAFILDALDKSENLRPKSELTYRKRIELSLLSYIELILNYSALFLMMPANYFKGDFESIIDSIYFSGVTITTLGYGDFLPVAWLPKFLVIHEVLAGFTLIIVSFALYSGKKDNEHK